MRNLFLTFTVLALALGFSGCSDDEGETPISITVSKEAISLTATGTAAALEVQTNGEVLRTVIPPTATWLHSTVEDNIIAFDADENTSLQARSAEVKIMVGIAPNTTTQAVTVSQLAGDPFLVVTGTSPVVFEENAAEAQLTVSTNHDAWTATVTSADSDWCLASVAEGVLTIAVQDYAVEAIREATVTISAGSGETLVSKDITVSQQGKVGVVAINVPASFSDSYVYKASFDGQVVAWICKEYVAEADAQQVVAYPFVDGVINLTAGLVLAEDAEAVYLQEGALIASGVTTTQATVVPLLLEDKRPGGAHNYKVVKIGSSLWMAENLQAKVYADGSAIEAYTDNDAWSDNTSGAWKATSDEAELLAMDGLFYNGYVLTNEAGIAPQEWTVASKADYTAAKSFLGTGYGTKMKLNNGWMGSTASNLSGFSAPATGYFSTSTGNEGSGSDIYYWTSSSESDWLTREDVPVTVRFNQSSSGFITSTHAQAFGHCIRCVKSLVAPV